MPRKRRKSIGRKEKRKTGIASKSINPVLPLSIQPSNSTSNTTAKRKFESSIPQPFVSPEKQSARNSARNKRQKKIPTGLTNFSVTKDVIELFIWLDTQDDSNLKKMVSLIRQKLELAEKNSVEVIDVDTIEG